MIKIHIDPPTSPEWERWIRACGKATREICEAVQRGEDFEVSFVYRRKIIKRTYFAAKDGFFCGKCAYCECYVKDFQPGDMEHFRPKRGVTDENGTIVLIEDDDGRQVPHPGYYWLAYDWRNLLLSCTECNRPNEVDGQKIGKHNRFPIKGERAASPEGDTKAEEPLLLHPCVDDPSEHLSLDPETGMMGGLTERGEMTVRILGLNLRGRLVEERQRAYRDAQAALLRLISSDFQDEQARKVVRDYQAGRSAFSMAGRAYLDRFKERIGPELESD